MRGGSLPGGHPTTSTTTSGLWSLFERRVRDHPEKVAIKDVDGECTYARAWELAARVASALYAAGVAAGDPVVICLDRGVNALVAGLGVAAAGTTAVPVETGGPRLRLDRILDASGAKLALVDAAGAATVDGHGLRCVHVDDALARSGDLDPRRAARLAYILFTSGSTGTPKGVEITQANLLTLLTNADWWETSTAEDVWAVSSSFMFDASVWEMWRPLTNGCTVS